MSEALDSLIQLLDLEFIEDDVYRGGHPENARNRAFGGQVIAQALMAAGRTVESGRVHSLHSYFLRPGEPSTPILFRVDRIREGRSFTTRRVVALQFGEAIFSMQASFHVDESQRGAPDRHAQGAWSRNRPAHGTHPVDNPNVGDFLLRRRPIDIRYLDGGPNLTDRPKVPREPRRQIWMRADGALPDDQLLHDCIVAYASDMGLVEIMMRPHSASWYDGSFMVASLDHCMWFHRPVRADEWLLYDAESPVTFGGRGLARGFIFSQDGQLQTSDSPRRTNATHRKGNVLALAHWHAGQLLARSRDVPWTKNRDVEQVGRSQ